MAFIELKNLSFSYDNEIIFDSISESFEDGSFTTITSAAGVGKTTLLKLIAGLKFPASGNIYINNLDLSKFTKKQILDYHRKTGFLFQDAALINNLNILDNLALYYKYNTNLKSDEILDILRPYLKYFELEDYIYHRPESLSRGNQIIVSFIRAISHKPKLIMLDEPIENLDQILIHKIIEELELLKKSGSTIILTTHRVNIFEKITDKVIILQDKKIIFSGKFNELKKIEDNQILRFIEF